MPKRPEKTEGSSGGGVRVLYGAAFVLFLISFIVYFWLFFGNRLGDSPTKITLGFIILIGGIVASVWLLNRQPDTVANQKSNGLSEVEDAGQPAVVADNES